MPGSRAQESDHGRPDRQSGLQSPASHCARLRPQTPLPQEQRVQVGTQLNLYPAFITVCSKAHCLLLHLIILDGEESFFLKTCYCFVNHLKLALQLFNVSLFFCPALLVLLLLSPLQSV